MSYFYYSLSITVFALSDPEINAKNWIWYNLGTKFQAVDRLVSGPVEL